MANKKSVKPDSTAVRVALWRAQHAQIDPLPHVLEDEIGLKLVAPSNAWRNRPDMMGAAMARYRASVVIRARFVEDLVTEQLAHGVGQYVILGAGLDTFAQRSPEIASHLQIFEIDRPGSQEWKRQRLIELGYGIPKGLHLVPVDFEVDDAWLDHLVAAGFDSSRPAVVASTGVSMYLTKEAIEATLQQVATFAPGSTFAMTFLLPPEPVTSTKPAGRPAAKTRSRKPFISFFTPQEMLAMARKAGFKEARHLSGTTLTERYFPDRSDSLPSSSAEEMLIATT
ncbi:class I SAM-dependent methyltransferase [Granulicella sp. S156]|jgi:methyltransferase (TIGR00027 family)|uniref:class I SAM-dependent methyltransferase n=1 Tax=Granulicella sp. S156 TaxID=1747224 RepID=UPI00131BC76B|nr:class I SAM-dependent methyltransferase [Granulicella sp. S156]